MNYIVDVNLMGKNSSNLQINKNTELHIITRLTWGGRRTNMQDSLLEYMTVPSQNIIILKSLNAYTISERKPEGKRQVGR